ncbi:AI-2E family transporter [Nonomuraea sp. NBC_01738]|uniref:AI-2E family transporter n=1 Tax=Nonomuraea sp. NBC_01738 TaxID=2976003 RepID=UPI002E1144F5|nr:AI-2E family transporter [Nonomuraea sp. NBC_01738]
MSERSVPRAVVVLLGTAAGMISLFGLREVASILGPVVLALVLVIAVSPVRAWLGRKGMPGWLQVALPFLIVVLVLLSMVAILTVSVTQLATLLPTYARQFQDLIHEAQRLAAGFGIGNEQLNKALQSFDPGKILALAQGLLSSLLGVLSSLFLIVVLLLAMCLDAPITSRIIAAGHSERPGMVAALSTFATKTRRYLIVSTVFGIICAALDVGALYLLSVPLPLLWGVLALITNYIPNIGFILGLIPPAILALLDSGPKQMILVIIAYCAINVVIQSSIQPKFLGDAVGLSTTMTFLSLIVWAFVLGPLGALLAIPLSLLTRALLIDSDPSAKWAAALISGEMPAETAEKPGKPSAAPAPAPSSDKK